MTPVEQLRQWVASEFYADENDARVWIEETGPFWLALLDAAQESVCMPNNPDEDLGELWPQMAALAAAVAALTEPRP